MIVALLTLITIGCTQRQWTDMSNVASCEGCHTDLPHLKAVFTPDTAAAIGGCGGEAPHYEPYDRVFMGGEGYESYKVSGHSMVGCTGCHKGTGNTSDKAIAHSGDFIVHPSAEYETTCGACHQTIVDGFSTSLHQGTGQKRKVTIRSGLNGHEEFHLLPANHKEGYNNNCAHCHGTCGNCHVVRPPIAGGGLVNGHEFTDEPDMLNICISCHASRGGHAYLGVAPGTKPDVHLTEAGYECVDCHTGAELHGNGVAVDHRYAYSELPECEDCHSGIQSSNTYHMMHIGDFNCQVCHSQDYNNCASCHIHGDGARIPSYLGFKIAKNPIPTVKTGYELALVRRTLAAPDNWEVYGVEDYTNFDAFPTYNYTTPHNLQRWTSRTQSDGACSLNCHIRNDGGTLINKNLYLFMDDLLVWEVDATSGITVDDILPASWITK